MIMPPGGIKLRPRDFVFRVIVLHAVQRLRVGQPGFSPAGFSGRKLDTSTSILGHRLKTQLPFAAIDSLQSITPADGIAIARTAEKSDSVYFLGSVTRASLEEIAAADQER